MFELLRRFLAWLHKGQSKDQPKSSVPEVSPKKNEAKSNTKKLSAIIGVTASTLVVGFVPKFEGMILRGYKDPVGIVTACAGHTRTAVLGKPYTRAECDRLLEEDLVSHAQGVMRCITVPTSVGERAAYVSFAYNVGVGAFCKSTLVKKLNAGDRNGACDELLRWNKAGGKVLKGLVRRREAERALCLQDRT